MTPVNVFEPFSELSLLKKESKTSQEVSKTADTTSALFKEHVYQLSTESYSTVSPSLTEHDIIMLEESFSLGTGAFAQIISLDMNGKALHEAFIKAIARDLRNKISVNEEDKFLFVFENGFGHCSTVLEDYVKIRIEIFQKRIRTPSAVFIQALCLIKRIMDFNPDIFLCEENIREFFIGSAYLSSCFLEDQSYNRASWAYLLKIPTPIFTKIVNTVAFLAHYEFMIYPQECREYMDSIMQQSDSSPYISPMS